MEKKHMKLARKNTTKIAAIFCALMAFSASAQQRADLSSGTKSILGSLAFSYELKILKNPAHEVKLRPDIGLGYFVANNWALGAGIPVDWTIYPNRAGRIGLKLFTTYFFNTNSAVYPYIGIQATPGFHLTQEILKFSAGLDLGLLVSVAEGVALDFGIKPEVDFKNSSLDPWKVTVPAGFLGVQAFF